MGRHSVVDAKNNLSELIARAEAGEEVVITRHGVPVVEIRPLTKPTPRQATQADIDWLRAHRVARANAELDAGTLVSRVRDEDWR
jgi:prevent-host-death family protein